MAVYLLQKTKSGIKVHPMPSELGTPKMFILANEITWFNKINVQFKFDLY